MKTYYISSEPIDFTVIEELIRSGQKIVLSDEAKVRIVKCRDYLDEKLRTSDEPVYGVNTGFGALHNHSVEGNDLEALQKNLVMSHACGTGEEVPQTIVKLMLLLKIQGLSYGNSGVQLETVQRLIDFYNHDVLPVVYQQGSLGASGDLAPLAHLSLPLIGEGEVYSEGRKQKAKSILKKFKWEPIHLKSKEGLALLNGTQFMSAYGLHSVIRSMHIASYADFISAISLDAFDGRIEPFDSLIQNIRPHDGQKDV